MRMLKERLQILVDSEQRRRLDVEARRRGVSVGAVVRDAIEAQLPAVSREQRIEAIEAMKRAPRVAHIPPDELRRMIDESHEEEILEGADPGARGRPDSS